MAEKFEPCGLICIDKPEGLTSHDVVNKIRRLFGTRKVGHTGTLDPMATGVLVVLVGRCAKASEYLLCDDKQYTARIKLGITTDSEDFTGKITSQSDALPSEKEFHEILKGFIGDIVQVPPMYSAIKVGGRKLYELARNGQTVEREGRRVSIRRLEARRLSEDEYELDVTCSKGTYIRTLCSDIGGACGCGGVMSYLRRVASGRFTLGDAHTLCELEELESAQRFELLLPTEALFADLPVVRFNKFYERLFKNGCEIYQNKVGLSYPLGTRLAICDDGGFYALGEVFSFEDGLGIKSIKIFRLD